MKEAFEAMLKHMAWADRRIGDALEGYEEAGGAPADSVRLYAHVVAAEQIWISRLLGEEGFPGPVFPDWGIAAARAASEETLVRYESFLAQCADFSQAANYRTSAGVLHSTSCADILTHVFLHGSYHRGQINARLRGAGLEPTNVDYITFVRDNGQDAFSVSLRRLDRADIH